jgi:N-acetylglucosamine repressor
MIRKDIFNESRTLSGKPVDIKQHNQRLVISLLSGGEIMSAGDLSSITDLSKTTISKILAELCKRNIVRSAGKGDSTTEGGKKPELFSINEDLAISIVLSMFQAGELTCTAVNLGGKVLLEQRYALDDNTSYVNLVGQMKTALQNIKANLGSTAETICAVAIAYSGVSNTETGEILYPRHSSTAVFCPLKTDLQKELPRLEAPIFIDNTCHYSGYAELLFPENKELDNLVVISCGQEVNSCILSDQRLMPGCRGIVGEFAHIVIDPDSPNCCYCGAHGCLESLLSERAILSRARKQGPNYPFSETARHVMQGTGDVEEIFAAAFNNDIYAQEVLEPIIKYLAILIRDISSLINVPKIILQGMYARAGNRFLDMIRKRLDEYNQLHIHSDLDVEFSKYSMESAEKDAYACIRGASYYTSNIYLERLVETFH